MSAPQCRPVDRRMPGDRVHEAGDELVVDVLVHDDPLGADAQLAGSGEAALDRAGDGPPQVGVGGDVERVLAAELEAGADQPPRRGLGDAAAGGGGAGEADVVDAVDDGLTGRLTRAEHHLQQALGHAGLHQKLDGRQGREGALRVGSQHHGVAREEGRERVADGQAQGVVPRRDDADDSLRAVVLDGPGEQRARCRRGLTSRSRHGPRRA